MKKLLLALGLISLLAAGCVQTDQEYLDQLTLKV